MSRSGINNSAAKAAISKRLVLGCGALVYDMVDLIKKNKILDQLIDLHCLPAKLHNTPQFIAKEVDKYLQKNADDYAEIFVAYGDCGTAGELDKVLEKYNAQRLPGAHCYEFFAGSEVFEQIVDEEIGSFFLTDYLVKFFDRLIVQGLGLDRYPELFEMYFKHYKKMVYLAQTENPELQQQAKLHAKAFGMEYEYRYVGIKGLNPLVENVIQPNLKSDIKPSMMNGLNSMTSASKQNAI
jgi:hypothetical protein